MFGKQPKNTLLCNANPMPDLSGRSASAVGCGEPAPRFASADLRRRTLAPALPSKADCSLTKPLANECGERCEPVQQARQIRKLCGCNWGN